MYIVYFSCVGEHVQLAQNLQKTAKIVHLQAFSFQNKMFYAWTHPALPTRGTLDTVLTGSLA